MKPLIAFMMLGIAAFAQTTTVDAVQQATVGAKQLRAVMNDPDSFVIDRVVVRTDKSGAVKANKRGQAHICYEVRGRNAFGGMVQNKYVFDGGRLLETYGDVYTCKETLDITSSVKAALQ